MSLKIVYIDDEIGLTEAFKDSFESDEFDITVFANPEEGINYIEKNSVDVLFIDYRMPNTTGDLIAKRLDPDLKKILITGELNLETETKFFKVVNKPFKFNEMNEILESLKK